MKINTTILHLLSRKRSHGSQSTSATQSVYGVIENEQGFVMVLSLMVLLVLTLLGISSNRTSFTEIRIARNDNVAKMIFYNAEAAAREVGQRLENESDGSRLKASSPSSFSWLS
ncbi:MAG: hypothetical protein D3924_01110, partial [Candidatus Electrothrix sp. AR4]|nr:hypothetical protein [Candidatus Electrothrix sp. AR4]